MCKETMVSWCRDFVRERECLAVLVTMCCIACSATESPLEDHNEAELLTGEHMDRLYEPAYCRRAGYYTIWTDLQDDNEPPANNGPDVATMQRTLYASTSSS